METTKEMKKYILIAIAGIALAAYIVPTSGWIDFNSAVATPTVATANVKVETAATADLTL